VAAEVDLESCVTESGGSFEDGDVVAESAEPEGKSVAGDAGAVDENLQGCHGLLRSGRLHARLGQVVEVTWDRFLKRSNRYQKRYTKPGCVIALK